MYSFVIYKKSSFFTLMLLSSALLPIQNLIVTESVFFVYFLSFFICVWISFSHYSSIISLRTTYLTRPTQLNIDSLTKAAQRSVSLAWANHVWMGKDMEGR